VRAGAYACARACACAHAAPEPGLAAREQEHSIAPG
jgi:hypothetical protein